MAPSYSPVPTDETANAVTEETAAAKSSAFSSPHKGAAAAAQAAVALTGQARAAVSRALAAPFRRVRAYYAHAPEPFAALATRGEWSTSLLDVCAQPGGTNLCCLTMWCPCIQYGLIMEQLPPGSASCAGRSGGSSCLFCGLWLLGDVAGAALLTRSLPPPCSALLHCGARGALRRKYNIQSHPLHDFFITWCCAYCALCQEARELVVRGAAEREGSNNAPHMATSGSLASGGGSGGILYANGGGGGGGGVALGHPSNVVRITSGSSALRKAAAAGQGQAQGQGLGGGEAAGSPGAPGSPGLGGSGGAVGTVVATGIPASYPPPPPPATPLPTHVATICLGAGVATVPASSLPYEARVGLHSPATITTAVVGGGGGGGTGANSAAAVGSLGGTAVGSGSGVAGAGGAHGQASPSRLREQHAGGAGKGDKGS